MLKEFFSTNKGRIAIWAAAIVAIGAFLWFTAPTSSKPTENGNVNAADNSLTPAENVPVEAPKNANLNAPKTAVKKPGPKPAGFTEKKTAHFVSSSIANNATVTQIPSFLTISFDAPLQKSTQTVVTVKKDDITSATMGTASIDDNKLLMKLNTQVTDGNYYVYYVACFADTGCQDGRFGYRVNLP
jgi:methionine-rich copper-binding protein CopC